MYTQKNLTRLFIAADTALPTGALPTVSRSIGFKNVGALLCDDASLVAAGPFQVLQLKADGSIIESPAFDFANILSYSKKAVAALAPQISHIGFNGTNGDIVETNSGNYLVTLGLKDIGKMIGNKRLYKFGEFVAPLTAVKADIAIGLAGSLALNQAKDAWVRVIPKAICSSAVVTAQEFANTATVVNGSKWFSVGTNLNTTAGPAVVVGDYIRFGLTVSGVPTVNSAVYKVVEISGLNVKLDRNVTELSGAYTQGNHATQVITAATALLAANKWGISLTGNDANAPFEVGKYGANLVYFSVGISTDFQTTEVRLTQTPFIGDGTYKQIATLDWELSFNGKEKYRIAEYPVTFTPSILTSDTIGYVYTLTFKEDSTDVIGGRAESLTELKIVSLGGTIVAALDTCFAP